jgi:hypothetical protein
MSAPVCPPNVGYPWFTGGGIAGAPPCNATHSGIIPPNVGYPWKTGSQQVGECPYGGITATGATAGAPGSFTPAGAVAPANLTAMGGITASPATAWTTGQYVVLGDNSHAYWSGSAWTGPGNAP